LRREALVLKRFPSVPRVRVVAAFVRRDFAIRRSYRLAVALDAVFGFLSLAVYLFISRTFGDVATADLSGAPSYFAFAAVGVALTTVVQAASAGIAGTVREEQLTGTLEALTAQPVTAAETAFGLAGFPFLFAAGRAAAYLVIAFLVLGVDISGASWVGFVVVLMAAGVALSAIGVALAALVVVVKRSQALVGVVTFALGFLGGAFFPIDVFPGWLQPLAAATPTRFAFDGVRDALFTGGGWGGDALALAAFSAAATPLALAAFAGALALARRHASLGTY
jgi:ABC-2 type transport system permease protein